MSNLLVTTSLAASVQTKRKAREIAKKLKGKFSLRGRKTVQEVVNRANKLGCERVAFVTEKNSKPEKICFYEDGWKEEKKI